MLKSYWNEYRKLLSLTALALFCAILLFYGGVAIGSMSGYYSAQAEGYSSQYPRDTEKRVEDCKTKTDVTDLRRCIAEVVKDSHESQRSEYDLQAQKEMSQWAWWLLVVSIGQIPIGIIGLFFLLKSISQAQEANGIASEIGQAQVRAYLTIENCKVVIMREGPPLMTFSIANKGQSPSSGGNVDFIPELHHVTNLEQFEKGRFTVIDFEKSTVHIGALAPGETKAGFTTAFLPKIFDFDKLSIVRELTLDTTEHFSVTASFFLKWNDVFGVECDSTGLINARDFAFGDSESGIICSADAAVNTSVYDSARWFKKWRENQGEKE